jgi:hypothetical protein
MCAFPPTVGLHSFVSRLLAPAIQKLVWHRYYPLSSFLPYYCLLLVPWESQSRMPFLFFSLLLSAVFLCCSVCPFSYDFSKLFVYNSGFLYRQVVTDVGSLQHSSPVYFDRHPLCLLLFVVSIVRPPATHSRALNSLIAIPSDTLIIYTSSSLRCAHTLVSGFRDRVLRPLPFHLL